LNKFLSLHKLTINRVITLPTVNFGHSELCELLSQRSAERSQPKIGRWERSGERELQKNDAAERSAKQEVAERQRSEERGLQK